MAGRHRAQDDDPAVVVRVVPSGEDPTVDVTRWAALYEAAGARAERRGAARRDRRGGP